MAAEPSKVNREVADEVGGEEPFTHAHSHQGLLPLSFEPARQGKWDSSGFADRLRRSRCLAPEDRQIVFGSPAPVLCGTRKAGSGAAPPTPRGEARQAPLRPAGAD
jgi:hypothetical protein